MHRHRLDVIDSYELTGSPVVSSTRLSYVPWVQQALQPYTVTSLPSGRTGGLWSALQQARLAAALCPPVEAA